VNKLDEQGPLQKAARGQSQAVLDALPEITDDQCIELAEELVWAKVRAEIAEVKAIAARLHEGPSIE